MGDDEPNPYAVLQVDPGADHEVVRAAYRALARRYHPDIGHEDSRRVMVVVNRAWELLSDANRRGETDRLLRERAARAATAGADASRSRASTPEPGDGQYTPVWLQRQPNRRVMNPWGAGAAGPPPGRPSGSIVDFGIYKGWSLGEVARADPGYLSWLLERPEGRPWADEIRAARQSADVLAGVRQRPRRRLFGLG
jgi:curved DNA-binding protein CbpA